MDLRSGAIHRNRPVAQALGHRRDRWTGGFRDRTVRSIRGFSSLLVPARPQRGRAASLRTRSRHAERLLSMPGRVLGTHTLITRGRNPWSTRRTSFRHPHGRACVDEQRRQARHTPITWSTSTPCSITSSSPSRYDDPNRKGRRRGQSPPVEPKGLERRVRYRTRAANTTNRHSASSARCAKRSTQQCPTTFRPPRCREDAQALRASERYRRPRRARRRSRTVRFAALTGAGAVR